MSVAFRRESDEDHKEPRFELPIPPGPNPVTARGLALIEAKVAALEAALGGGDDDAVRRALRYWHTRRTTAVIAPTPPGDEAGFGSRVVFTLNGKQRTIEIVGSDEADPDTGRVGFQAPLAQALIGAGPGDRVAFGGREDAIEVVAVTAIG